VPNLIKFLTSFVVGMLSLACVTAFVFNQTLTSLLATSGLMAMVIGLAVQANIANVFSGIVLNIERPFRVGDYVTINGITGTVIDITWRTTRIESTEGHLVCLANSKVSEAEMHVFSAAPDGFSAEVAFYFDAAIDPVVVLDILKQGAAASTIMDASEEPVVSYRGIVCKDGFWPAEYVVTYHVKTGSELNTAKEELWISVRNAFQAQNLELYPQPGGALGTA
jgi:small-conductance mechanosensitive channel